MKAERHMRAKIYALIAAAGAGSRMGRPGGKQLINLDGKTVIRRSCEAFEASNYVDAYVVLTDPTHLQAMQNELHDLKSQGKCLAILQGGDSRQATVMEGLRYLQIELDRHSGGRYSQQSPEDRIICLVHDGARCLVSPQLIDQAAVIILDQKVGTAPALPATDTVRILHKAGEGSETPPRAQTLLMQTPQGADLDVMLEAYYKAEADGLSLTDDVQALEHLGYPLYFYEGDRKNIKLTRPEDLALASFFLNSEH